MKLFKTLKIGKISCKICIFTRRDQLDGRGKNNNTLQQQKLRKKSKIVQYLLCYQGEARTEHEQNQ